jgi:MFS transporter, CP family, cyanate transporter
MNGKQSLTSLFASKRNLLLIIGVIFIALNLRAAIASVGPLVGLIRSEMEISNGTAGLLTTLPLFAFAIISPIAPRLGEKFGPMQAISLGLLLLTIGIVVRSTGVLFNLFFGTALLGIGIAICNVLLPGIVKKHFSTKAGLMTGAYTLAMGTSAGIASGVSFPIASVLEWNFSLVLWAILSCIGLLFCLPHLISKKKPAITIEKPKGNGSVYKSRLAWEVTLFMGLQSLLFFCMVAWLPEIITSFGYSETVGGLMLSFIQILGLPSMFLIPILADRFKDQRGIVLFIGIVDIIGFSMLLFGSSMFTIIISVITIGIGQGAAISLSLALIGLRTTNVQEASNLSGMAQSIGYLMAAVGPFLMGVLFDLYHTWSITLTLCLLFTVLMVMVGLGASKNKVIFAEKVDRSAVYHS